MGRESGKEAALRSSVKYYGRRAYYSDLFAHRYEQYDMIILSQWVNPADTEKNVSWTRETWQAMQPFVERGVYVNNLGEEGHDRVRAAYGPNYERLVMLKNKYDPVNLFHVNQNVRPTISAS